MIVFKNKKIIYPHILEAHMYLVIVGNLDDKTQKIVATIAVNNGWKIVTKLARATQARLIEGPMGIPREEPRETDHERQRKEYEELQKMHAEEIAAFIMGYQDARSTATRFTLAHQLAGRFPEIPMIAPESASMEHEVRRYYPESVIIVTEREGPLENTLHRMLRKS